MATDPTRLVGTLIGAARGLGCPVSAASTVFARRAFYFISCFATLRFMAMGWVTDFYVTPNFHFTWPILPDLRPLSATGMYLVFTFKALSALLCALGLWFRPAALVFLVTHTYVELLDKAYYLNHQYLVGLMALLFVLLPRERSRAMTSATLPRFVPLLLATQVGLTYFFAGLSKLDADFLGRGEPLHTWLQYHAGLPVVGPLLALKGTAKTFAVLGTLFDLGIVPALLSKRLRLPALLAIAGFHLVTGLLFNIGLFPFYMVALATLLLPFDWPLRVRARAGLSRPSPAEASAPAHGATQRPAWPLGLAAAYLVVQIALPLRHLAYDGAVNWTEEGFRFAWRVMLVEKAGHVEFDAQSTTLRNSVGRSAIQRAAMDELTPLQRAMMRTQPDMIRQYAVHVAKKLSLERNEAVTVTARAWIAMNGHPARGLAPVVVRSPRRDRHLHDAACCPPPHARCGNRCRIP